MAARIFLGFAFLSIGSSVSFSQTETLDGKIERLVAQERDILFDDATLRDVMAFLETNGIPSHLDQRAIEDVGLAGNTHVTFRHRGIRLSDGLSLLLRQLDLVWTIRHGRLIITTPEEEENHLITRVYDVRNLVELVPVPYWSGQFATAPETIYRYDFEPLLELIRTTVAPNSWNQVGGPGSIEPYWTRRMRVMVVLQSYEIHQQIESLLRKLAKHGGRIPLPPKPAYTLPIQPRTPGHYGPFGTSGIRTSRLRTTGQ